MHALLILSGGNDMNKRLFTVLLSAVMLFTGIPVQGMAADNDEPAVTLNLDASENEIFKDASANGITDAMLSYTVKNLILEGAGLNGANLNIAVGDELSTIKYSVIGTDKAVHKEHFPVEVISSNPASVEVVEKGSDEVKIKALRPGTSFLTFILCGKTKTVKVNVKAPIKNYSLMYPSIDLAVGNQVKPYVILNEVTDDSLIWKSEDPKICSVDKNGFLKGTGEGETKITVYPASNPADKKELLVKVGPKPSESVKLEHVDVSYKGSTYLTVGEKANLFINTPSSKCGFETGKLKIKVKGKGVIKVDKEGHITARKPGVATVSVWSGKKNLSGDIKINVGQNHMKLFKLNKSKYTVKKGHKFNMKLKVNPGPGKGKQNFVDWTIVAGENDVLAPAEGAWRSGSGCSLIGKGKGKAVVKVKILDMSLGRYYSDYYVVEVK